MRSRPFARGSWGRSSIPGQNAGIRLPHVLQITSCSQGFPARYCPHPHTGAALCITIHAAPQARFTIAYRPQHGEREVEPRARWIQRYAFNHGVVPVPVAEKVAASLTRLYGIQQCHVIPNCIPVDRYACPQTPRRDWRAREGFADRHVLFVCVARFAGQKNHALLLRAFAQGPASNPNAHLVLVGDGELREQLEDQANDLGLGSQVRFLGLRTDIPDVLGAMDVFVLSSDWEGNPLSVIEAMASGLPVVSTAVGGVPDLFESGKEGLIVRPGDVQGLSNSMAYLLENREARLSMGMAAAQRARENYDVSTMVQAYEELYEDVVNLSHTRNTESVLRKSPIPL